MQSKAVENYLPCPSRAVIHKKADALVTARTVSFRASLTTIVRAWYSSTPKRMDLVMVGKHLIETGPKLVKQAARSPLGLAALAILVLSVVVLSLFSAEPRGEKLGGVLILAGVMLSILAMFRTYNEGAGEDRASRSMHKTEGAPPAQAAAICFRRIGGKVEFLLVHSSKGVRRIFPKGNVNEGEAPWSRAAKEAKKEAGVEGRIQRAPFTTYWHRQSGKRENEWSTAAFLLEVTQTTKHYEPKRNPAWYSLSDAEEALSENRDAKSAEELRRVVRAASAALSEG